MSENDKDKLMSFSMFISFTIWVWIIGLSWHYYIEPNQLGPWFTIPALASVPFGWMLTGALISSVIDAMGWWE